MTITDILDGLIERLQEVLKDFPSQTSQENTKPFKVFRHKIPERLNKEFDYSKGKHDEVYPFCIVKIDRGSKEQNVSNQDSVFNIIIGVKNEGQHGEGYDDVVLCIQRIWNNLNENPVIAKFHKLKNEIEWAVDDNDEQTHPFYYGVLQITIESPSMQYVGGY